MATAQQPSFTAYVVTKRGDDKDDWWNAVGVAFPHQDGQGFNILLDALPLNGKIVLRPPKQEEKETPANNGKRRQENAGRSRR
ncbi:MAG TPA: hypothetical protein VKT73_04625 [Xanthobacteraceae bacterium]|nr:hypothetical protein [Xanthobacteraceae bacterium]